MIRKETRTTEVEFTAHVIVCDACGKELPPSIEVSTTTRTLVGKEEVEIRGTVPPSNDEWSMWSRRDKTVHLCEEHDLEELISQAADTPT